MGKFGLKIPASLPAFKNIPHFLPGRKKIYFPKHTITFIQSSKLGPMQARFSVPLDMNKLDLRDYLFHGYGVRAFNIRSFIRQRPVETHFEDNEKPIGPNRVRIHRRQPVKFMTVEMSEPFVWPPMPGKADLDEHFNRTYMLEGEQYSEEQQKEKERRIPWAGGSDSMPAIKKDRISLAEQAKKLLDGRTKWSPTWQTLQQPYER